jgi:aspartate/methionine/tyrosine aminotransferase
LISKPVETLREIARFCKRNDLHFISDEIFALSVYENAEAPDVTPFVSVLGAGLDDCIDRHMVHVMYGMGKDFGATGLRIGALQSANEGLIAAVSSIRYVTFCLVRMIHSDDSLDRM